MTNHDAAFLWETSALRRSREHGETSTPAHPGWVTLREAHRTTGVPIDTIRKWGRQGSVPSMVVETDAGVRRLVRLESAIARARQQGRTVTGGVGDAAEPPGRDDGATGSAAAPAPDDASGPLPPAAPEGNMIVPIAAWDRMLMQLGNLHEAGQQLADARERAARAETEAAFLRERLAELRTTSPDPDDVRDPRPAAEIEPPPPPPKPAPAAEETVWSYAVRRWRRWREH